MTTPCPYDPRNMFGEPTGLMTCPQCGEKIVGGIQHYPPDPTPLAWQMVNE